jgi:hypothetical protein
MNNIKQLTTGTGESQKYSRKADYEEGQQANEREDNSARGSKNQTRFNTIEQGNMISSNH